MTAPAVAAPAAPAKPGKKAAAQETPTSEECLGCHADKDLKRSGKHPGKSDSVAVDPAVLEGSMHGALDCVSCHVGATAPHDETLRPVRCASCHDDEQRALATRGAAHSGTATPARARENHATTTAGPPACRTCHGTHAIRKASLLTVVDACAGCHAAEVAAWKESIHGKATRAGATDAATCASCHGSPHTLLPNRDPRASTYHLNLPRTCAQCHANPELARKYGIDVGDVYRMYMDSIHGRAVSKSGLLVSANCSDCHGAHDIQPRTEKTSRVHRTNVPSTCGGCHAGVLATYRESIHGKQVAAGDQRAPVCIDCHSAHQIRRVEAESWRLDVIRECGTCHGESFRTYRDTFHGKVTALGFSRVARCSDCHGAHDVFPKKDPKSSVHASNLVATCRKCHENANWNFAQYDPHANPEDVRRSPLLHYTWLFMTWLLIGTFSFFGIHTVLWGARSLVGGRGRPGPDAGGDEEHRNV